jgi:4-hydroxybenzoate polyprenyltransferase
VADWLRLVRAHNLLIAAAGVLAGGWIALARVALTRELVLAALSGAALGAAGNALNDLHDVAADRVNRPGGERPLAAGRLRPGTAAGTVVAAALLGLGAAGLVSGAVIALAAAALVAMIVYSPLLKPRGVPGNLAVAAVAGLPLPYGALAVGAPWAGLVPWTLAAWLHLVRELVKDVEDAAGDRVAGRRTVALTLGPRAARGIAAALAVGFVPLSVVLPWAARYGAAYFVAALPAWVAVLVAARALRRGGPTGRASLVLKGAMAAGLAALVAGRVV